MLKITRVIEVGDTFTLRNKWRTEIATLMHKNEEHFPFNFKVVEINQNVYVCESIPDKKSEKIVTISVTADVIQYVRGDEVQDCFAGCYFLDYLPVQGTKVLLTNPKTEEIIPAIFELDVDIDEETNLPLVQFLLYGLMIHNNKQVVKDVYECKNLIWKPLYGTDEYMTNMERMYQDTFIHKDILYTVCETFAQYLKNMGFCEEAEALMERALSHDNSKIVNKDEFRALTAIINDKSCLGNARAKLSQFKQDAIELHWHHNSHHPEHFANPEEMSKIDRLEMVCDWMARSLQYKNDLLPFVETRQAERFHFPYEFYMEIHGYCEILTTLCTPQQN